MIFNNGANIFVILPGRHELTGLDPTIVRGLQQLFAGIVDVARDKHFTAIAVVSIHVDGNVEIDNIAIL